jgi:hypothetical protein
LQAELAARIIAEHLNLDAPLLLTLTMENPSPAALRTVAHALKTML